MGEGLSRREFLKLGGITLGSYILPIQIRYPPPEGDVNVPVVAQGRVASEAVYCYQQPSFQSQRLGFHRRDEILNIYKIILSPDGPEHNPRWYRVASGHVHSAHIQRVEGSYKNKPVEVTSDEGLLGEITMPYTRSYRYSSSLGWTPLYRLYYQSVHWITGLDEGPDGAPWYRLTDDLLRVHYHIPAVHMRPVHPNELKPIFPDVPPEEKHILISTRKQTLTAYHDDLPVLHTSISSGIPSRGPSPNGIPTETPKGRFRIQTKMPSRHMGDGELTADINAYELLGVPWVCFFHETGVATHGTYWHDNFGRKMSHGCVNMRNQDARWIYRWTTPVIEPGEWYTRGSGTLIEVI
jgi:hypothetical protein